MLKQQINKTCGGARLRTSAAAKPIIVAVAVYLAFLELGAKVQVEFLAYPGVQTHQTLAQSISEIISAYGRFALSWR